MSVTGPKIDTWLVQTFGLLVAAIGSTLLLATRRVVERGVVHVGLATALALAVADVWFVLHRRIGPVYLVDAIVELGLATGWVFVLLPLSRRAT